MEIIFSPSFDNGYYINLDSGEHKTIGTKIVGLAGLLEHLSLRNGLSGLFASDGERAAAYLAGVRTYLAEVRKCARGSMIEESFKNDALGVAKCLLHWRDLLIMSGWDPCNSGDAKTPKLQLLSQIERSWKAQMKGDADRWSELAKLPRYNGDRIECRCAKAALPRLVQDVLEKYGATFAEYDNEIQMPQDAKISVIHYTDLADAYRQVAANMDEYANTVVINRDNVALNHFLISFGKPQVDATIADSNPLTLQLFKLAMSVFSRPLNIHNLLSYLQLPVGPVPSKLRHALANVLITNGGFGDIDWNELDDEKKDQLRKSAISTQWELAIYDYINAEPDKKDRATLLNYITDNSLYTGNRIPTDKLKEYIAAISRWAASFVNNPAAADEMIISQLCTVISYFNQLSNALDGTDWVTYEELEKHIRTIYQPTTITQARAQLGSLNVVGSYSQLIDHPANLLWIDCCGADEVADQYEFLSTAERKWLNDQPTATIPKLEDILDINRKEMIAALAGIKGDITLVAADYYHGQKMAEHPIIAELKMQFGERLTIQGGSLAPLSPNAKNVIKLEPKDQYQLDSIVYAGRSESNTSIDTLINYPFDYTVEYIARLRNMSLEEVGSLQKTTGLVAHSFIQDLVNSTKGDLDKMEELLCNEYDARLQKAIYTTGLALLLKENEVEYNNVRHILKSSIETLIAIMRAKELKPVACELKCTTPLDAPINDFNARIDMVLEDKERKTVVFDFKWSYSNSYGEKIKDGKAIQLELYRQELVKMGKTVSAVGYYLFPLCLLITPDFDTLKDTGGKEIIRHINPSVTNVYDRILQSFTQRINDITAGNIEEGEGMDISARPYSVAYSKNSSNMLLVGKPKRTEEIIKDSKTVYSNKPAARFTQSRVDFQDNNGPLNETPTTHPLMKGRLK